MISTFIRFDRSHYAEKADWKEKVSDCLLTPLHLSTGFFRYKAGTADMVPMRVNSAAITILSGIIALTLLLPFTIAGVIIRRYSATHQRCISLARRSFPPRNSSPSIERPPPQHTPAITTQSEQAPVLSEAPQRQLAPDYIYRGKDERLSGELSLASLSMTPEKARDLYRKHRKEPDTLKQIVDQTLTDLDRFLENPLISTLIINHLVAFSLEALNVSGSKRNKFLFSLIEKKGVKGSFCRAVLDAFLEQETIPPQPGFLRKMKVLIQANTEEGTLRDRHKEEIPRFYSKARVLDYAYMTVEAFKDKDFLEKWMAFILPKLHKAKQVTASQVIDHNLPVEIYDYTRTLVSLRKPHVWIPSYSGVMMGYSLRDNIFVRKYFVHYWREWDTGRLTHSKHSPMPLKYISSQSQLRIALDTLWQMDFEKRPDQKKALLKDLFTTDRIDALKPAMREETFKKYREKYEAIQEFFLSWNTNVSSIIFDYQPWLKQSLETINST